MAPISQDELTIVGKQISQNTKEIVEQGTYLRNKEEVKLKVEEVHIFSSKSKSQEHYYTYLQLTPGKL